MNESVRVKETFGEWMHAPIRGRRFDRTPRPIPDMGHQSSNRAGNRFDAIATLDEVPLGNTHDHQ